MTVASMLSLDDVGVACQSVEYKPGWTLRWGRDQDAYWLQWLYETIDSGTRAPRLARGRKWRISYHSTRSEVVWTAFKAALTNEEHECREFFRYAGAPIAMPHFDVDELAAFCVGATRDARTPPQ
jgi:hypothetical protein